MRVTVRKGRVLERRLVAERIADLGVLESTEVKFWINTIYKHCRNGKSEQKLSEIF